MLNGIISKNMQYYVGKLAKMLLTNAEVGGIINKLSTKAMPNMREWWNWQTR